MSDNENKIMSADYIPSGVNTEPRMAKGGVFAIADIELIKNALVFYTKHNGNVTEAEERQAVNLLHRLNNRA